MPRKLTAILPAALWITSAMAQTAAETTVTLVEPGNKANAERALREYLKRYRREKTAACSIPLREVPVAKKAKPIRNLRPAKPVEPMPLAPLPAPPCEENRR